MPPAPARRTRRSRRTRLPTSTRAAPSGIEASSARAIGRSQAECKQPGSSERPTGAARDSAEFRERAPDAAHRLPDAVLVLDEREAHETFPAGAEPDARRHGDLRVTDQQ